jgi:hypothetical protein
LLAFLDAEPLSSAWLLITVGAAWAGAVSGVLIRMGGIQRIVMILGLISMLFIIPGTVLGIIVLVCLLVPATQAWLAAEG